MLYLAAIKYFAAGANNSLTQGITNLKLREEEDMAELEKRYQERVSGFLKIVSCKRWPCGS